MGRVTYAIKLKLTRGNHSLLLGEFSNITIFMTLVIMSHWSNQKEAGISFLKGTIEDVTHYDLLIESKEF